MFLPVDIPAIFQQFSDTRVLVVGDVMMDVYLFGVTNRISPEAPVPIVELRNEELRLGGAANVAVNLKALGAKVMLCSVVGDDSEAYEMEALLDEQELSNSYLYRSKKRITTKKTRIISRNQQMLRFDHEHTNPLGPVETEGLLEKIKVALAKKPDVVILQDYNKGVLTEEVIQFVIARCHELNIPVAVDPKKANFLSYKGATLFKPNLKETCEALSIAVEAAERNTLDIAARRINEELNNRYTLITLSDKGVYITNHQEARIIPAMVRNVADVSGAGDTVISVAALCLAQEVPQDVLATLANMAGGLVCERVGVVPIDKALFQAEAEKHFSQ